MLFWTPIAAPFTKTENVHEALTPNVAKARLIVFDPGTAVITPPPQLPVKPLSGANTISPDGSVSVKEIPFKGSGFTGGFATVKLRAVLPKNNSICESANDFEMVGGASTIRVAEAVKPVPPLSEVMCDVVLFFVPADVPVTSTTKVHELRTAMVPPVKLMVLEPAAAVMTPVQEPPKPFGVATISPGGKLSVNATPVRATVVLGFPMVNVKLVMPLLSGIEMAPKAFWIVGGATTVILAEAVFPGPPFAEFTIEVVLFCVPGMVPVTGSERTQLAPPATVAPVKLTLFTVTVAVPPQAAKTPGEAIARPRGSVSVNPTPVSAMDALGFAIVKFSNVFWLSGTVGAAKPLLITGGEGQPDRVNEPICVLLLPPVTYSPVNQNLQAGAGSTDMPE